MEFAQEGRKGLSLRLEGGDDGALGPESESCSSAEPRSGMSLRVRYELGGKWLQNLLKSSEGKAGRGQLVI